MSQTQALHHKTHRQPRRTAMALVALAALWHLPGCRPKGGGTPNRGGPAVAVFVLFDLTGCIKDPAIQKRYEQGFEDILTALQDLKSGAIVKGDKITHNTQATASYPIKGTLPAFSLMTAHDVVQDQIKSASDTLRKQAKGLLQEKTKYPNTDLMNAFGLADKVFNGEECSTTRQKLLVVFSDMIEQSGHYNFVSIPLDDTAIQSIIAKERKSGQLPKLNGVKVWVAGATASTGAGLSSNRIHQIQDFWLAYFKACGADLTADRYAPTLLGFALGDGR